MAKNQVLDKAKHLTVPVPVGVVSGDPVVVGAFVGVALIDRTSDGQTVMDTEGVYEFTVNDVVATFGVAIYAIVAGGLVTGLTTTVGSNVLFGHSYGTLASAPGKLPIKIHTT